MKWFVPLLLGVVIEAVASVPFAMAAAGDPLVLELFTSQGCSSCPPADRYLGELQRERPDVLVLDFHIDYWDSLGWKDPFSMPAATARQQTYDRLLGSEVYTPQLVVGGSRQAVGSDQDAVAAAIAEATADRAALPPVALGLSDRGSGLTVDAASGSGSGEIWLVGYDDRHVTAIGRGENGGLTETEVDIVRSIRPIAMWSGGALHVDVPRPAGQRAAVLLQQADGRIRAAAALSSAGS
ncbi:DUF1223 domain-containing protein [Acidisoma sp.]|uniref:DUF1223 domain-containing protein n=1 Tax=Acidisoma sp. TaxID=1872115 RepID=UPI003AFFCC3B